MKRKAGIFFAALISMQGIAHSATVDVIGADGVNGADGIVPGSDGQHGTAGETGFAQVTTSIGNTDTVNQAIATGGFGGSGGDGADGLSEPGIWDGGNGGNGGSGGGAIASSNTTNSGSSNISADSSATGGTGGSGGQAGFRADLSAERGTDGNAGAGGAATATGTASHAGTGTVTVSVDATGGTGGNMTPSNRLALSNSIARGGARAGDGGTAEISAFGESLSGRDVTVSGVATGGNGGNLTGNTGDRIAGISAGNGANTSFVNAVDGSTTGNLSLSQNAIGGNAGAMGTLTGFGSLGAAGTALSSLTKTTTSLSLNLTTQAVGGNGADFMIEDAAATFSGAAVGGDGATGTAHSTAINLGGSAIASAFALGGNGGDATSLVSGIGTIGGNGGQAVATAYAEAVGGTASATAGQTGGDGGIGWSTGMHGRGADSIMVDAVSGSSDVNLRLTQRSVGGAGAAGIGGGDASSLLTATNPGGGGIEGVIQATAGNDWIAGSSGSNAHAAADLSANGRVTVDASAAAGHKGCIIGISLILGCEGGNGGNATLGPVTGTSLNGGDVVVSGTATGGNGGPSTTDRPGNGASVSLVDVVDGSTTGSLSLRQTANGGHGNSGATRISGSLFGLAGEAFSSLTKTTTDADELVLNSIANGGSSFNRFSSLRGVAADGGLATGIAAGSITSGSSDVSSSARGGTGGAGYFSISSAESSAGAGGDAVTTSDSTVINGISFHNNIARSSAIGGIGGNVFSSAGNPTNLTTDGGNGGNASSTANATSNGVVRVGSLTSQSTARGGNGGRTTSERIAQGGDGGNAFAQASSTLNASTSVGVSATATATGGHGGTNTGSGVGGRGGNATAIADVFGAPNAFSTAVATPGFGQQNNVAGSASATARISNGTGVASAEIGNNNGFVTNSTVSSIARGSSPLAGTGVEASVSVGSTSPVGSTALVAAADLSAAVVGLQSVAQVNVLPDATAVNQALAGNSGVASNFDLTGGSDMLALMTIGAMQDGSILANSFSNDIDLSMDMSLLSTQQDLIFGFMNPVISGNGFDSMTFQVLQEGAVVLDMLFNDVVSAESFFSDQTVNLGDWTQGLVGDLDLSFFIDFDISDTGDGYYFDIAYGNSTIGAGVVPVPGAVWLFGSGLIALLGYARKRQLN